MWVLISALLIGLLILGRTKLPIVKHLLSGHYIALVLLSVAISIGEGLIAANSMLSQQLNGFQVIQIGFAYGLLGGVPIALVSEAIAKEKFYTTLAVSAATIVYNIILILIIGIGVAVVVLIVSLFGGIIDQGLTRLYVTGSGFGPLAGAFLDQNGDQNLLFLVLAAIQNLPFVWLGWLLGRSKHKREHGGVSNR
jgi:hypothetical protein